MPFAETKSLEFSCLATFCEPRHHKVILSENQLMLVSRNGEVLSLVFDLSDKSKLPCKQNMFLPGPVYCCAIIGDYLYFSTSRNVQKLSVPKLLDYFKDIFLQYGHKISYNANDQYEELLRNGEIVPCRNVVEILEESGNVLFKNKFGHIFTESKTSASRNRHDANKLQSCLNMIGRKVDQLKEEQRLFQELHKYLQLLTLLTKTEKLSKYFSVEAKFVKCECAAVENRNLVKVTISVSSQIDLQLSKLMQFVISLKCKSTGGSVVHVSTFVDQISVRQRKFESCIGNAEETLSKIDDCKNLECSVDLVLCSDFCESSNATKKSNIYGNFKELFVFGIGKFNVLP